MKQKAMKAMKAAKAMKTAKHVQMDMGWGAGWEKMMNKIRKIEDVVCDKNTGTCFEDSLSDFWYNAGKFHVFPRWMKPADRKLILAFLAR